MNTNYIEEGYKIYNNDKEEIIHIPYNTNNFLASEDDILDILKRFNVTSVNKINHIEYFHTAFTHKSYCKKTLIPIEILNASKKELGNPSDLLELMDNSYEMSEFFGDKVIKLVFSYYLLTRYPKENEGFVTRLQTKMEDKKELPKLSKKLGLGKFFIISKQIENLNGRNLDRIHEDVFEAFMAALFRSNGFEPCFELLLNLLETSIDYSQKLYHDNNYKDSLLRYHHKQKWQFPKYETIHSEGPPHKRKYIMGVINPLNSDSKKNKYISYGIGSSKKEGEQAAAKMSLIIHGILKQDQYTNNDLYYPDWDKINNFDGDGFILNSEEFDKDISESDSEISIQSSESKLDSEISLSEETDSD